MNSNDSDSDQSKTTITARLIEINDKMLRAEEEGQVSDIAKHLHQDFKIIRANLNVEDLQTFLRAVPDNAKRGRTADQPTVQFFGNRAIYTCLVTTKAGHFWNTRLFVRRENDWLCVQWQVMKIADREPTNAK